MYSFVAKQFPTGAGCYLMRNAARRVIYVGKAKNLRRRLSQYFQESNQHGKVRQLAAEIASIEVYLVSNELESLILENNLIKRYKPRYNVMLIPDNSGYSYIVQTEEAYPRILAFRKNHASLAMRGDHPPQVDHRYGPYLSTMTSR